MCAYDIMCLLFKLNHQAGVLAHAQTEQFSMSIQHYYITSTSVQADSSGWRAGSRTIVCHVRMGRLKAAQSVLDTWAIPTVLADAAAAKDLKSKRDDIEGTGRLIDQASTVIG